MSKATDIEKLKQKWAQEDRWSSVVRTYSAKEVVNLRGSFPIEYTLARMGAERFWRDLQNEPVVSALGAVTGNQAVESVAILLVKCTLTRVYIQLILSQKWWKGSIIHYSGPIRSIIWMVITQSIGWFQ